MIFFDLFPKEKIKIDQFAHILGEKLKIISSKRQKSYLSNTYRIIEYLMGTVVRC